jgi:rare lipoprotein A
LAWPDDEYTTNERKYVLSNQNTTQRRPIKTAALAATLASVLATGLQIQPSLSQPHWSAADLRNEGQLDMRSKAAESRIGIRVGDAFSGAFARGSKADRRAALSGVASVYHDRLTANGEHMNPAAMTAAHKTLPFGSRVTVVNKRNGRSATVRINDRGPYVRGRVIDLSPGAARVLGVDGLAPVSLTVNGRHV